MAEDASVFRTREGGAVGPLTQRDESQFAQARREPYGEGPRRDHHDVTRYRNAHDYVGEAPVPTRSPSITAVADALVIHAHRPIANLPQMDSPELKLIGRCVSFRIKQRVSGAPAANFYYTGLVSTVTANAVTLTHVNRYTHADFKAYKVREERIAKKKTPDKPDEASPREQAGNDTGLPAQGYTADGAVGVAEDGGLTNAPDPAALLQRSAAGSLAPATALTNPAELWAAEAAEQGCAHSIASPTVRARHFRAFDGSVGPIPYVTFLRKSIHDVAFGRDPRSAFYALFQDPAKGITDMQFLRMFVRRYLVHTSENNNPRQVPIYAFLSVRLGWPTLDRDLVNQLVREELCGLLTADRAVAKARKQERIDVAHRVQELQQYHAPHGLFARTGVLYLTRIPQTTVGVAVVALLCTVAFAIYLGVMRGAVLDPLMDSFLQPFIAVFVVSIVFFAAAGVAVILHAVVMHIPLFDNVPHLVARVVLVLGALACGAVMMARVVVKLTNLALYEVMVEHRSTQLCAFYRRHTCTGFYVSCGYDTDDPNLCSMCPSMPVTTTSCDAALWGQLHMAVLPLLVLTGVNLLVFLMSFYLLVKAFVFVDSVMGRIV